MSNIVPFQFESQDIRTITNERGEPWFVLRDVLDATQSKTTVTAATDAINQGLGDGFAGDIPILDPLGREQVVRVIAEAAVTYLLSRSNTEQGRKLNRFIHVEVLPAIRKTGHYTKEPQATLVLRTATDMVALAHLFGFTGNQALLSADRATNTLIGVSPMQLLGAANSVSGVHEQLLTVTKLGKLLGLSAVATNKRLIAAGLQTAHRDAQGDLAYAPTEAGSRYGVFFVTNSTHGDGTPVQQIRWYAATAKQIQEPKD